MKLVSIGNCSIFAIYPISIPLLRTILNLILPVKNEFNQFYSDVLLSSAFMFISEIFISGFYFWMFYLVNKRRCNKERLEINRINQTDEINSSAINITYINTEKKNKYTPKLTFLILGLAAIDFSINTVNYTICSVEYIYLFDCLQIVFYLFLTWMILHYSIYSHHFISICIIVIGTSLTYLQTIKLPYWYYSLVIVLLQFLGGIQVTYEK